MSWRARENFLEEKKSKLNPEVLARWTELEDYFTAQVELNLSLVNIVWWWFSCQVVSESCDPMDCSLPDSSVHGILQARILEWVTISFSRGIFPTQGLKLGLLHCRRILY